MLARANRVLRAEDFRSAVRRGSRATTPHLVVHQLRRGSDEPTRFGFITAKAVGNAVERNLVRRRLRSVGRDLLGRYATGRDIVIRALPGSPEASWATLHAEVLESLERGVGKR